MQVVYTTPLAVWQGADYTTPQTFGQEEVFYNRIARSELYSPVSPSYMKKLILLAVPAILLFAGAHSAHAATPAPLELDSNQAQQLKLALDATALVLNQVQAKIDASAPASIPNTPAVKSQLASVKTTLTSINTTLAGEAASQSLAASSPIQGPRSVAQANGASQGSAASPVAPSRVAQEAPEAAPAEVAEAAPNTNGRLASVSAVLKSSKFLWTLLAVVIVVAVGLILFFRRRKRGATKPTAAAPVMSNTQSAQPETPAA